MRRLLIAALLLMLAAQPAAAQVPTQRPAPPTGLRPGLVTATLIEIVWDDVAADETSYELLHGAVGAAGTILSLPADTTTSTLVNLTPDDEYFVRVRACRAGVCSSVPPTLLVRTLPPATVTPSPEPTATATATPTETPTPTATATPAPCPGVYGGLVVSENTLTLTCVKATEQPWPDGGLVIPDWRVVP